ncbi:MAG: LysR family transcriptional regulator [Acidaminococcus sp.]|jgi:DNA-binding transcriptional LysR family regulator|nr:LysR family transcriptional regulator [Acidaminococcus sp.]MCI2100649.1 LysR family transcriptional regulator [Acidaminococcus sp.]MCI2114969.1 LysR family transcriptional regulator [Acidaminococcus sp.]MCI2117011.1 LysR family transcriptional regulator [Acidaminococcus sp.]
MDIRQMKYFLAVAEEGLITTAAERLHMTQSPLSQQMITLEKEIGVPLFKRTKKKMILTEAGKVLRHKAKLIVELSDQAVYDVRDVGNGMGQRITIGSINSSGRSLFPMLVKSFKEQYPRIQFDLRQGNTHQILDWIDHEIVHLGFIRYPVDSERYHCLVLPPERQIVIASKKWIGNDSLPSRLEDLVQSPVLLHRRYASAFLSYFQEKGLSPYVRLTSDEIIPLLTWADCGLGIAIVPEFSKAFLAPDKFIIQPIQIPMNPVETSALIWQRKGNLPTAVRSFIGAFQEMLKKTFPVDSL